MRPFHFATGVTTLIYQLGGLLRQLRKRYPNAEIRVTVGVTEEMVAGLLDRRFDLALISLPVSDANLRLIPLFDEELLIVRPSAKKAGSGPCARRISLRPHFCSIRSEATYAWSSTGFSKTSVWHLV